MTKPTAPYPLAERVADRLHELLCAMVRSWGMLDVGVEVDGHHVDAELLFAVGPDMGLTLDVSSGGCRYCELPDDESERWLEHDDVIIGGLSETATNAELEALLAPVLDGLLAARRPLLRP